MKEDLLSHLEKSPVSTGTFTSAEISYVILFIYHHLFITIRDGGNRFTLTEHNFCAFYNEQIIYQNEFPAKASVSWLEMLQKIIERDTIVKENLEVTLQTIDKIECRFIFK